MNSALQPDCAILKVLLVLPWAFAAQAEGRAQTTPAAQSKPATRPDPELQLIRSQLEAAIARAKVGAVEESRGLVRDVLRALGRIPAADSRADVMDLTFAAGRAAYDASDLRAARQAWERVLSYREQTLREDDRILDVSRECLAIVLHRLGESARAAALFEKVLDYRTRTLAEDHLDLQTIRGNLALVRRERGDLKGARDLQDRALAALSRSVAEDDLRLQGARLNLAVTIGMQGDRRSALALEEKVVASLERTLADDHPDLQTARQNLAASRTKTGDLNGARELEERVLEARSRRLPADHPELMDARHNLLNTLRELGDYRRAFEIGEQALTGSGLPEGHPSLAEIRVLLAKIRREMGDLSGARVLAEKALQELGRTLDEHHPSVLSARKELALILREAGDYPAAVGLLQSVLDAYQRRDEPGSLSILEAKEHLAITRRNMGDLEGALVLMEEVHRLREQSVPEDDPELQDSRQNLAAMRGDLGDWQGALALQEKAMAACTRTLPGDHPDLQMLRQGLGASRQQLGDLQGAHVLFVQALEVLSRTRPEGHPERLIAMENLAIAKCLLGEPEAACRLLEQVLAIRAARLDANHPDLLKLSLNLGRVKLDLGDLDGAHELFVKADQVLSQSLPPQHPLRTGARLNLGTVVAARGELREALPMFEEVAATMRRNLPDDHPSLQLVRRNLGTIHAELGDRARARRTYEECLAGAAKRLEVLAATLSPRAAEEAMAGMTEALSSLLSFADPGADQATAAACELGWVVRFRGLADRHSRVHEAFRRRMAAEPALVEVLGRARMTEANHRRALMSSATGKDADPERMRHEMESAEEALARAASSIPEVAALAPRSPAVLAERLPRDGAAIVTTTYTRYPQWDPVTKTRPAQVPMMTGFVLSRAGQVQRIDLGELRQIQEACNGMVEALTPLVRVRSESVFGSAGSGSRPHASTAMETLARVLDPLLAAVPPEARTLFVSPEGPLASIPWEALTWRGRPLRQMFSVRYVDTLAALQPRPAVASAPSLFALGGIDYDAVAKVVAQTVADDAAANGPATAPVRPGPGWQPLAGSLAEVRHVAELFHRRWPDAVCRTLTGSGAAKNALLEMRGDAARYFHLATHGFVAAESEWRAEADRRYASAFATGLVSVPLGRPRALLSGVVLAGANRKSASGPDDALLTSRELATLDLTQCELAVLSACSTNVGHRYFGEAVAGLNRALHMAGARNTITSLWKVDDHGAMGFFDAFYRALFLDGVTVSRALETARETVIAKGYGPGVWSAFVLYVSGPGS